MARVGAFDAELAVALKAARGAAAAILAERRRPTVSIKPDGSPVTSADLAADAAIRAAIRESFPDDAILSEEVGDDRARLSSRRCWLVDPLDGTSYFVTGSDDFDTFVALTVGGVPVVAIALQPATGILLGAVAGQGAWRQVGDGSRERLEVTPRARRLLATKSWLGAPANLAALDAVASAVSGSLVHASFSLCPRCFAPPEPSIEAVVGLPVGEPLAAWEWDIAAADLIVRESGGASSDLTGAPLRYNKADPRFAAGLIIAADPALHRDLLGAVARSAPARHA